MFAELDVTAGPGGVILIILAILSLISLTVVVLKGLQLLPVTSEAAARDAALQDWTPGNRGDGSALASGKSPASRVLGATLAGKR